jgi:coenzyme F420-0:L-glutamate ligase/coenzyme F420-1:gamma-L-glutamate ligase
VDIGTIITSGIRKRLERLEPLARLELTPGALRLLRSARVAHLATADAEGQPHVIPICFAYDGREFFSPIDEKPKRASARSLKRVRNILENPQVALIVDRYDENWTKLAYILVLGTARVLSRGENHRKAVRLLRRKYSQYVSMAIHERPMIVIKPRRIITWGAI